MRHADTNAHLHELVRVGLVEQLRQLFFRGRVLARRHGQLISELRQLRLAVADAHVQ